MKQRGIALVQVLFISAILMVVILSIQASVHKQVQLAGQFKTKNEVVLKIRTVKSELLYEILQKGITDHGANLRPIFKGINFYGQAFEYKGVKVTLQDEAGLLYMNSKPGVVLSQLIRELKLSSAVDRQLQSDMTKREIALPFPEPYQLIEYIKLLPEVKSEDYTKLEPYLTLIPAPRESVAMMPNLLLKARFTPDIANALIQARDRDDVDVLKLSDIANISADELISFQVSSTIRMTLELNQDGVGHKEQTVIEFTPYRKIPMKILEFRKADIQVVTEAE